MDCLTQKEELENIINYYKKSCPLDQETIVELLREIQDLLGCIPEDIQDEVATSIGVKPIIINQIVKRYPSLTSKANEHTITLCLGAQCSKRQAAELLNKLKTEIVGKPFQLKTQNCLKHCKTGPNLRINDDLYSFVKPEEINTILKKYVK